jgi:cytochrome c-type biogenesis protein CcmH
MPRGILGSIMAFWIIVPLLTILAAGFVTLPVLRARQKSHPKSQIEPPALAFAESELPPKDQPSRPWPMMWLALGLAVMVAVPSIGLYAMVGRPDLATVERRIDETTPQAQAPTNASPADDMASMIGQLESKVQRNAMGADAWQTLGSAYMHVRRPADAVKAYRHAVSLAPKNSEYLSALAEATIQDGSGKISDATVTDLKKVTAADPSDPRARFYLALYRDQKGDHRGAIADWIRLLKEGPADAAWVPEVRGVVEQVAKEQHIDISGQLPPVANPAVSIVAESAPGPNSTQVAAAQAMPAGDRNAMIHAMLDRLAAQLLQNPHDSDGWLRLMRARMVLGEKAQALAAYHGARSAFAQEPAQLTAFDKAAHALGVAGG